MKNFIKGLIVFFSVLLVVLIGTMTYALVKGTDRIPLFGGLEDRFSSDNLLNTQKVSLEGISEIKMDNYSCDVYFLPSEGKEMVIKEYAGGQANQKPFVKATEIGNSLKLKVNKENGRSWFIFGNNARYYEVYLPSTYAGMVAVEAGSGDVYSEMDLALAELNISTHSGSVELRSVEADKLQIETRSGDIEAESLEGDMHFESTSGELQIDEMIGKVAIKTSSGDVSIDYLALTEDVEIETSSGEVRCEIPQNANFQFKVETSSGDIVTSFDQYLSFDRDGEKASGNVGDGDKIKATVRVKTSSGDIDFSY